MFSLKDTTRRTKIDQKSPLLSTAKSVDDQGNVPMFSCFAINYFASGDGLRFFINSFQHVIMKSLIVNGKRDDFNFEIVNFPFLDGDVPRSHFLWRIYFSAYSFCKSVF